MCKLMHESMAGLSNSFHTTEGRHNYITPSSYFELLKTVTTMPNSFLVYFSAQYWKTQTRGIIKHLLQWGLEVRLHIGAYQADGRRIKRQATPTHLDDGRNIENSRYHSSLGACHGTEEVASRRRGSYGQWEGSGSVNHQRRLRKRFICSKA
jgi:hypothetical protein